MILIADSGSTKTHWVSIENGTPGSSLHTVGMNPYFIDSETVVEILRDENITQKEFGEVDMIFFYGAGCSSPEKQDIIKNGLAQVFPNASIEVEHDMVAAARALFADGPGIACILGTGSNACVYDGSSITQELFSLGYMFGDEGSGGYLGKSFLFDYLKGRTPGEINTAFESAHHLSPEDIITSLYKKPNPNRFLATFAPFLKEHLHHPYVNQLASKCFDDFFREQVARFDGYQNMDTGFIGSVAFHFQEMVTLSAKRFGLKTKAFLKSPMEGLVQYHLQ